jgi:hypothetical protein
MKEEKAMEKTKVKFQPNATGLAEVEFRDKAESNLAVLQSPHEEGRNDDWTEPAEMTDAGTIWVLLGAPKPEKRWALRLREGAGAILFGVREFFRLLHLRMELGLLPGFGLVRRPKRKSLLDDD